MKKLIAVAIIILAVVMPYVLFYMPNIDLWEEKRVGGHEVHVFCFRHGVLSKTPEKKLTLPIRNQTGNYPLNPSGRVFMQYLAHCTVNPIDFDSAGYVNYITKRR